MTRGRICSVCVLRLAVYLAAILAVKYAAGPVVATRIMIAAESTALDLTVPLLTMLMLGVFLEVVSGAARWR